MRYTTQRAAKIKARRYITREREREEGLLILRERQARVAAATAVDEVLIDEEEKMSFVASM